MDHQGKTPKQYRDSSMILFLAFVLGWVMFLICALSQA